MANIRHGAIAAGFMHALRDPEVFAKWQAAKNDQNALASLIQSTLGLAQAPSASDMDEMRKYAEQHLTEHHADIAESEEKTPHAVGFAFTTQS